MNDGVLVIDKTSNKKTGPISVTWSNKYTCSGTCPFLGICYPNYGNSLFVVRRLDDEQDLTKMATKEADGIKNLKGDKNLRLKVYGDCPTEEYATIIADASREYKKRSGKYVYGYTHAWNEVKSETWDGVSMLASCETPDEVNECKSNGWATAIAIPDFPDDSGKPFDYHGIKVLPCPNQTKNITCDKCKLCMKNDVIKKNNYSIGFKAHGSGSKKIKNVLNEKMNKFLNK